MRGKCAQGHTDRLKDRGDTIVCLECANERAKLWYKKNKEKRRQYNKEYRDKNRESLNRYDRDRYEDRKDELRSNKFKRKYGITLEQRDKMIKEQNGTCLICKDILTLEGKGGCVVDHCHETGEVRGILCSPCNSGIGHLKDDVSLLYAAIEYLKREEPN